MDGRIPQLLGRRPAGTPEAVASFLDRAVVVARSIPGVLLGRSLRLPRAARTASVRAVRDLLTHHDGLA